MIAFLLPDVLTALVPVPATHSFYVGNDCLRSVNHAFITSRLDYCNGLYARCNESVLQRLQRVQNCAARYILNAPPRSPSLPLLHQLHWLPIESRMCYKLCSLMYRVNHNTAPSYLSDLCVPCSDTRLRSTTRGNYMIPRTLNRAFAVAAPSFWNSLPDNVRDSESYSNFFIQT